MFHFSRSVVKGLGTLALSSPRRSLAHSFARSPSSHLLLPSLPFSSPQVLSNLSLGRNRRWLLGEVCVSAFVHVCVFLRACVSKRAPVYSVMCVHVSPRDSVCALFKPTVSKALQGSLCIIGDLLLSAHCI